MKHKPIPKRIRELVYQKYDGHCAYCGCSLEYKDMQVDHMTSIAHNAHEEAIANYKQTGKWKWGADDAHNQDDSLDNLMPACRQCNFYKQEADLEGFRSKMRNWLEKTCRNSFQVQLAIKHGILEYKPWDGKFYFEKLTNKTQ